MAIDDPVRTVPNPPEHVEWVYNHLRRVTRKYQDNLAPNQALVVRVKLSSGEEIVVSDFGYAESNLLVVRGDYGTGKVEAFIHQSSLQVLFSVVPRGSEWSSRPVGFLPAGLANAPGQ